MAKKYCKCGHDNAAHAGISWCSASVWDIPRGEYVPCQCMKFTDEDTPKVADKKIDQAGPKAPLGLIPLYCLVGLARVLQYGAKKYAPGNWFEANMADGAGERYYSAALRHLMSMQGSDGVVTLGSLTARDAESLLPHIDHAICSLVMLRGILQKTGGFGYDPGKGVGVA